MKIAGKGSLNDLFSLSFFFFMELISLIYTLFSANFKISPKIEKMVLEPFKFNEFRAYTP